MNEFSYVESQFTFHVPSLRGLLEDMHQNNEKVNREKRTLVHNHYFDNCE